MKKKITSLIVTLGLLAVLVHFPAFGQYESYVDNLPQPKTITAETQEIQQELEEKVQEMANLGHLAPTLYFYGLGGPRIFYTTPGETIYALAIAYPYLSASLKSQVKAFLDNEITSYPPHSTAFYPPASGQLASMPGARREYFPPNPSQDFNYWDGGYPPVHVSVLYPIWAYSYYTDDWTYAGNNYASLKNIYANFKASGPIQSYPELSGVIGFARIAKRLGYMTDANDAQTFANQGFADGANFDQFLNTAQSRFPTQSHDIIISPLFFSHRHPTILHFNQDIGLFIKDHALAQAQTHADTTASELPYWWITEVGLGGLKSATQTGLGHGENIFAPPDASWTNFMLHAYVLGDSVTQLKSFLDKPDRKGDLLYLQKLVAIIDAGSGFAAGDVNQDGQVNFADALLVFQNWGGAGTGDANSDGKINGIDLAYVIRDWGK